MTGKSAKLVALRLLKIKSRTILELRKKLTLKGFSLQEIEEAISMCCAYGYLNDEEEGRRRYDRLRRRGYGPHFIAVKLQSEGLQMVKEVSFQDQIATIRNLITKPIWKKKEKKTVVAALKRRGFDFHCIIEAIGL